jgi:hypothetical protein
VPPPGPHPQGYAAPPQYAPPGYAPPQWYAGPTGPPPPSLSPSGQPLAGFGDGLWQLWDKPWQQCLHDKFAGTVVVKVST